MKKILLLILLQLGLTTAFCQKYDFNWPLGYNGDFPNGPHFPLGMSFIRFDTDDGNPRIERDTDKLIYLMGTSTAISDKKGNHKFAFNGYWIEDHTSQIMENGGHLGYQNSGSTFKYGCLQPQCAIALPNEADPSQYLLLHQSIRLVVDLVDVPGWKFYASKITYPPGDGSGKVKTLNDYIFGDTLETCKITVTRHANGRDWWLLLPDYNGNNFFTFLVTPEGPTLAFQQKIGPKHENGLGFATFSPDGSRYARINSINDSLGTYVDHFAFDRCTGLLSDPKRIIIDLSSGGVGVGFSTNNRFLYISFWKSLYQVDLESPTQDTTLAAYWDGFVDTIMLKAGWHISTTFGPMQIGPDGRMYSFNFNSTQHFINVIEKPNLPAPYCEVRQHSLHTPTVHAAPPNFPYFRLGPVDGSICDSLGIDNVPWCWWRYKQDTTNYGTIFFTDASAYEPTNWRWDFGDGSTSQDTSPVHKFPAPGVYEVCLTVSNANGADTLCRTLHIATVSADNPIHPSVRVGIFPNPFSDGFNISLDGYLPNKAEIHLFDMLGREVAHQRVMMGDNGVYLPHLKPGVYHFALIDAGVVIGSGKIVKMGQ